MGYEKTFITDPVTGEQANVNFGGLDVNLQDQTSRVFANHFSQEVSGPWLLNSAWAIDTYSFEVVNPPAHGIIAGDNIFIFDGFGAQELFVISVTPGAGFDTIEVDAPAQKDYAVINTEIFNVNFDLNVSGALTRQSFRFPTGAVTPPPISLDVTQVRFTMIVDSEPSDELFGNIAALTRGLSARHHRQDGINQLATMRNNLSMAVLGNLEYGDKAGGTDYSVRTRFLFGGQANAGVVLRIEPGDYLELIVQDDLTSIVFFHAIAIGHLVVP
jgi:hypothetical protein